MPSLLPSSSQPEPRPTSTGVLENAVDHFLFHDEDSIDPEVPASTISISQLVADHFATTLAADSDTEELESASGEESLPVVPVI